MEVPVTMWSLVSNIDFVATEGEKALGFASLSKQPIAEAAKPINKQKWKGKGKGVGLIPPQFQACRHLLR